jgi:HSP20 family protein
MADKNTDVTTRERQGLARRESSAPSPFRLLERFADEMESMFDDVGFGRGWLSPRGSWSRPQLRRGFDVWAPDVEISQQDNELVVRADLPGMKKDDISIDVTSDDITISGERRQEQQSERGGVYRSERSYGAFCRTVPLPEGAITDQATATFKDGVLEIRMPAPPEQVTRGRRLEIKEGAGAKK